MRIQRPRPTQPAAAGAVATRSGRPRSERVHQAILTAAKVRAVALVAGELGTELPGEKKSVEEMKAAGYPAELFVMPKTAHLYSANIDDVMREALGFVLAH